MTLAPECGWAAVRAAGVAFAAVLAAAQIRALLASASRRTARALWAAHLAPCLTPALLVGYGYASFSLSLVRAPAWNEAFYVALLWLRLTPVATLVLAFAPSPASGEAAFCYRLLRRPAGARLAFWLQGAGRVKIGAAVVVFLLAFAEFEIASLLGIHTWTVALFDAQVGGLALAASLRLVVPALLWQAVPLLLVLALITSRRSATRGYGAPPAHAGRAGAAAAWAHLAAALAAVTVVPACIVLHGTLRGLALVGQTQALGRDVAASVAIAAMTGPAVYLLAGWLLSAGRRKAAPAEPAAGWRRWAVGLCVFGLLGPLVVSLAVLRLFQVPGFRSVYDTAVPLVLAQIIVLLPFGVLLRALLAARRPGEAVHAGALLLPSPGAAGRRARDLLWTLVGRGTFWAVFLLSCWAYLELTASAILSPSRMTPVMVRLYNFMHYGRTSLLSAMVCVAFLVPFGVLLVAEGARRGIAWCLTR